MQEQDDGDVTPLYPSDAPTRTIMAHQRQGWADKSLPKGIMFDATRQRFRARVMMQGQQYHGGWHATLAAAVAARNRLAVQLYGSDARLVPVRVTQTSAKAAAR